MIYVGNFLMNSEIPCWEWFPVNKFFNKWKFSGGEINGESSSMKAFVLKLDLKRRFVPKPVPRHDMGFLWYKHSTLTCQKFDTSSVVVFLLHTFHETNWKTPSEFSIRRTNRKYCRVISLLNFHNGNWTCKYVSRDLSALIDEQFWFTCSLATQFVNFASPRHDKQKLFSFPLILSL